jgi:transcriptional regulator with XRE-family HTH domain
MQTNLIILGRAFLHKRLDLKLEIKDVAEKSGLSTLTVSKLEKGQLNNTSVETLEKMARTLGMELTINVL